MERKGWYLQQLVPGSNWYQLHHDRLPVVIEIREADRVDMEVWGEAIPSLDAAVKQTAEFLRDIMMAATPDA